MSTDERFGMSNDELWNAELFGMRIADCGIFWKAEVGMFWKAEVGMRKAELMYSVDFKKTY